MKRLTLKRSLELCKELWSWLRDNPDVISKNGWPKWYRYIKVEKACFACEYDLLEYKKQRRNGIVTYEVCSYCPLKGLWGNNCMKSSSPYSKWCYTIINKNRQKYAGIIADFCDKELQKMNKKGTNK